MPQYVENEKSRAERIAEAKAEYNASLQDVTGNSKLYLAALNNMCDFPYSPSECLYLAHHLGQTTQLDTFEGWNEQGYRISKGEKGLTLLEENNGDTVFFDVSQTNAPSPDKPIKAQRMPNEKLSALWSCDVRILTASKAEYTKGLSVHFDTEHNAIIIDRNAKLPHEQLFSILAKETAHAYLFRNSRDTYRRESCDGIANAAMYMVCRLNDIDCSLPQPTEGASPKEVKSHLESTLSTFKSIQSNIEYYYANGKAQNEKPQTVINTESKEKTEVKDNKVDPELSVSDSKAPDEKPKRKSIKDIIRDKKEHFKKAQHTPRHYAKVIEKGVKDNA